MATVDSDVRTTSSQRDAFAIALYCITIFLSAALLFCVEPMFSKMVLPVLGGSAAVWSVAMVVFQGLLLAGYVYAHLLSRYLRPATAALLHVTVMAIGTLSLPIALAHSFAAPPADGVSLWLIGLFLASIGLPCFAISANAPLLQAWFAQTEFEGASNPYFLYRASNAGSFLVLLAYPFLIEPALGLSQQGMWWNAGYALLMAGIALCGALALLNRNSASVSAPAQAAPTVAWRRRLAWIALGFVPSGLLVAVTAHIATDVASAPFLWIVPLALYLLTFVFAFTDKPAIPLRLLLNIQPLTVGALIVLFLWSAKASWAIALPCHLIAFFIAAMICHTQLYRLRPAASGLTGFYAWMSFGGVLGGMFAALLAPHIFTTVLEYPLLLLAALLARPGTFATSRTEALKDGAFALAIAVALTVPFFLLAPSVRIAYFMIAAMTMAAFVAFQGKHAVRLISLSALLLIVTNLYDPSQSIVARGRSFYGVYKVVDLASGFRIFIHGTIAHGAEAIRDAKGHAITGKPEPLSYYYRGGAFSEAVDAVRRHNGGHLDNVALVGLGIGSLSCFSEPRENWRLYELDPLVVQIAENPKLFRSMASCAPHPTVLVGDGRLTLRDAKPGLDLLILDVFSSDAVPTHLLTKEAFALYRSKLGSHGVIVFNISNRNMQLANVVAASAAANGMVTAVKTGAKQADAAASFHLRAEIAVVARSQADIDALKLGAGWRIASPNARLWTDDYSNVLGAILQKLGDPG